jgi:hypothetical protein
MDLPGHSLGRTRGLTVENVTNGENASKVAMHLAVLEGMDKKTGPRYLPRLNIRRMLHTRSRVPNGETAKTDVRHDTTDAHGLKHSIASGMELPA